MTPFRFFAFVLLPVLIQPTMLSQVAATQPERPSAQVDKLFEKMDRTISPGCAVAAMRDGKILYQRGYGMADLDHNVPITAGTVLSGGRISMKLSSRSPKAVSRSLQHRLNAYALAAGAAGVGALAL